MSRAVKKVLLITADQWRGYCLSASGHRCVWTPNYDLLIDDGIYFRRHYSVCAPCGPARASLLTGMYMQSIGRTKAIFQKDALYCSTVYTGVDPSH